MGNCPLNASGVQEYKELLNAPIEGVTVGLVVDEDLMKWEGSIVGVLQSSSNNLTYSKRGTPYDGGIFKFEVDFPSDFPFKPPKWKPAMSFRSVLLAIQDKLYNPKADDPFEPDVAQVLKEDPDKFKATAKEWTKKYAHLTWDQ
ncbi:ubiquitin-conjugating enzyme [Phellopilus nigrolimitatus]|nr:ubiquitin-conjugating enzyme [Phellopilus nigrolimitatus]